MRAVRNEIKEAEKLLEAMKERARSIGVNFEAIARASSEDDIRLSNIAAQQQAQLLASGPGAPSSSTGLTSSGTNEDLASKRGPSTTSSDSSTGGSSGTSSSGSSSSRSGVTRIAPSPLSYRMKYFNSLNLAPSTASNPKAPLMISTSRTSTSSSLATSGSGTGSSSMSSPSTVAPSSPLLMSSSNSTGVSTPQLAGIPELSLPLPTSASAAGATTGFTAPGSPTLNTLSAPPFVMAGVRMSPSNDQLSIAAAAAAAVAATATTPASSGAISKTSVGPTPPGGPTSSNGSSSSDSEITSPLQSATSPPTITSPSGSSSSAYPPPLALPSSASVAAAVVAAASTSPNVSSSSSGAGSGSASVLDFQAMMALMKDLEKQAGSRKKAAEELKFVQVITLVNFPPLTPSCRVTSVIFLYDNRIVKMHSRKVFPHYHN
jgi:hypothetical protein